MPRPGSTLRGDLGPLFSLIQKGRAVGARIQLEKLAPERPDDGQVQFLLGLTYHQEKRYTTACQHFDEAARLEPEFPFTYYFRGWALYYLGRMSDAQASFREHLEFAPDEPDTIFALGLVDFDEDRLDDAEIRFRRSIDLQRQKQPPRPREVAKGLVRLADVHERRDELSQARTTLEEALQLFADHYEAWYKLHRICRRLDDEPCARRALEEHDKAKKRVRPGTAFPE